MRSQTDIARLHAKIAEHEVKQTAKIAELGERATQLASIRRLNLSSMNSRLLWAEWYFLKALHDWTGGDEDRDMFLDACTNLKVDEEGISKNAIRNEDGTWWGDVS